MSRRYITIDGGTTNTRISYVIDKKIIETVKLACGSNPRDKNRLTILLKEVISKLVEKYNEPICIIGCGMLTSEYGIKNIPHISSPSGVREFHNNMTQLSIPSISKIDIFLIPGFKNSGDDFLSVNIMRGEETEIIGLCDGLSSDTIYVLPGSHSKIIQIENGKILSLRSFMTGEMYSSLSKYTILSGSIKTIPEIDDEYLKFGYEFTSKNGINESLLKVRTMDIMFNKSQSEIYSFFMGCILEGEIKEIIKTKEKNVVIGGQKNLKELTSKLLSFYSDKDIITISDEKCDIASIYGMIKIFEYED